MTKNIDQNVTVWQLQVVQISRASSGLYRVLYAAKLILNAPAYLE